MFLGYWRGRILIADAHSLKDKRRVLRQVKDRLAPTWAIREVQDLDLHQSAVLATATVGNDKSAVESALTKVQTMIERLGLRLHSSRVEVIAIAELPKAEEDTWVPESWQQSVGDGENDE